MNDLDSTHASFYRPSRIGTVLVANRGEIAVRVIRAAHELGMRAVAAVSDADRDSLAARMADEAVHIGPSHAAKSYLDPAAMLAAARQCGADAIHPGYGFLSENADFAAQVEAAGLIFVGPPARVIATMGDKARARETARRAGVPTVPGSEGVVASLDGAHEVAARIGYPVMIKAAAGAVSASRTTPRSSPRSYRSRSARHRPRSATAASISNASSRARGTSKCRSWATARTLFICSNANARCSGGARRFSRKRRLRRSRPRCAMRCAHRRRVSRGR